MALQGVVLPTLLLLGLGLMAVAVVLVLRRVRSVPMLMWQLAERLQQTMLLQQLLLVLPRHLWPLFQPQQRQQQATGRQ
jgi:hypothetical protein